MLIVRSSTSFAFLAAFNHFNFYHDFFKHPLKHQKLI